MDVLHRIFLRTGRGWDIIMRRIFPVEISTPTTRGLIASLVLLGLSLLAAESTVAQFERNQNVFPSEMFDAAEETDGGFLIDVDNELIRKINTTQQLALAERPLEAANALQSLIEHPADFFVTVDGRRVSSRQQLSQWIETLPRTVLTAYETQYNPHAKFLLERYQEQNNIADLVEASRLYLHTTAGAEATYLLASLRLDQGEYLAGLTLLTRLQEIPRLSPRFQPSLTLQQLTCLLALDKTDEARKLLIGYLAENNTTTLPVAGNQQTLEELLTQLNPPAAQLSSRAFSQSTWPAFRRTPSRQRQANGFSPLPRSDYTVNLLAALLPEDLPRPEIISDSIEEFEALLRQHDTLPAWNPIILDGRIFVAGFGSVAAFSVETGQLLWKTASRDRVLEYLQNEDLIERLPIYNGDDVPEFGQYLLQQLAGDLTAGTLSSDGQRIFALSGNGLAQAEPFGRLHEELVSPVMPGEANVLTAYSADSGKLLWEIGGQQGQQQAEFAGHFFLGPPLLVDDKLLVMSETGVELYLSELDPDTGAPRWIQPLVHPELPIMFDRRRRVTGTPLSYKAPYMFGCTNSGVAFAFDVHRREFLWLFNYMRLQAEPASFENGLMRRRRNVLQVQQVDMLNGIRWQESAPVVNGTNLYFTPTDSQDLYCCDLLTGKLKWIEPRLDGYYVEAAGPDRVLVVGRRSVRCLDAATGDRLWSAAPPSSTRPSGRGIVRGDIYHLPTFDDGITSFDLKSGHVLASTEADNPVVIGNLVVSNDRMLSVGYRHLTGFTPLNSLEEMLAGQSPDRAAERLSLSGKLALHTGNLKQGLSLLQQSYQLSQDPAVARQLTKTLLSADVDQIELTEQAAEELTKMMVAADHSTEVVFRYVDALQRFGKTAEAIRVLEQIIISPDHRHRHVSVTGERRVQADRLASAKIREMSAIEEQSEPTVVTLLQKRLDELNDSDSLLRLMPLFIGSPLEADAKWKFLRIAPSTDYPLIHENYLGWLSKQATPEQQAELLARRGQLYLAHRSWTALLDLIPTMSTQYAETPCLDDQNGTQLAATWRNALPASSLARLEQITPATSVDLSTVDQPRWQVKEDPDRSSAMRGDVPLPTHRTAVANDPFSDWAFELFRVENEVHAYDPQHEHEWAIQFPELSGHSECNLQSEGHLLIAAFEGEIYGVDGFTLLNQDERPLPPNWRAEMGRSSSPQQALFDFKESNADKTLGITPLLLTWGQEVGQIAGCVDQQLVYREESQLIVRDARSGRVSWDREVANGEETVIWADSEFVYELDLADQMARRYELLDGAETGRFQLPNFDRLYAMHGSVAVFWRRLNPEEGQLFATDLRTGLTRWQLDTTGSITIEQADFDKLIYFDPAARTLTLLDPEREKPIFAQLVAPETHGREMFVVADEQNWYVHLYSTPETMTQPIAPYSGQHVNGPVIAIERRSGRILWQRDLELVRWIPQQWRGLPVLLYGSIVPNQVVDAEGNPEVNHLSQFLVIDKQTGTTLSEFPKSFGGRFVSLVADPNSGRYVINFDSGSLLVEPAK